MTAFTDAQALAIYEMACKLMKGTIHRGDARAIAWARAFATATDAILHEHAAGAA